MEKNAISEREHSFLFRGCLRFLLVIIKDANIDLKIAFVIILTYICNNMRQYPLLSLLAPFCSIPFTYYLFLYYIV